jgi:hypothetical protein
MLISDVTTIQLILISKSGGKTIPPLFFLDLGSQESNLYEDMEFRKP